MESKFNKKEIERQMIEITLANDVVLDVETLEEIRAKGMKPIAHLIGDWHVKSISSTRRVTLIDKMAFAEKAAEELGEHIEELDEGQKLDKEIKDRLKEKIDAVRSLWAKANKNDTT